ncbi:MAG: DNA mismatch repair endonuclease MutL [Lacipirellulaceae bacterium]
MSEAARPPIRMLPPLVVNKIAAGEVVERPASVVKELLENAIDAGATRVDVVLERGGADLVRVVDNGRGIPPDELELAVTNHATSKITSADELFEVNTLGFRGEALASIASVSRLVLRSRQQGATAGAELRVDGGTLSDVAPAGAPVGTTIEVRDLFYNTPVRKKFLRSPQTEAAHATEALARVALAHPRVHFTLSHGGRLVHDLPPCVGASGVGADGEAGADLADWRDRIATLFGEELAAGLVPVASDDGQVRLEGFVADPAHSRSHTKLQHLFVNGRAIRDRALQHALGEAYRGLLLTGRKPICFLRLEMPPAMVDVNVHPMKLEVRFSDGGAVYSQLLGTLRAKFLSTDLRARAPSATSGDEELDAVVSGPSAIVEWARTAGAAQADAGQHDGAQREGQRLDGPHAPSDFRPYPDNRSASQLALHRFVRQSASAPPRLGAPLAGPPARDTATRYDVPWDDRGPLDASDVPREVDADQLAAPAVGKAMQLHNRYLVVETAQGMEVIDQHALHERVLYERLRTRILAGPLETQRLLVPEPVDLAPAEAAAVLENRALLGRLGIEAQPFGGDTVLVASFPTLLGGKSAPADVLRDVAARLVAGEAAPDGADDAARDLCDHLLSTMACKAAVKYGDPLSPEEVEALLAERPATENHHHCPHGRPTSLVFTREELDRRFGRT